MSQPLRNREPTARLWSPLIIGAIAIGIFVIERRRAARPSSEPEPRRTMRNLTLGALSMSVAGLIETPIVEPLARRVQRQRLGLAQQLPLPAWARDAAAAAAMDYTIYLWHVATHRVPILWRFHQVHHLDRDLDSTTALRFHFAEMLLSVPYRALQVVALGTSHRALTIWQRLFFLSVLFHHSNIRLPRQVERGLGLALTTPGLHAIHHSRCRHETSSNWSSGLNIWDRLHGTLQSHGRHDPIVIGPPEPSPRSDLAIGRSLLLPFSPMR